MRFEAKRRYRLVVLLVLVIAGVAGPGIASGGAAHSAGADPSRTEKPPTSTPHPFAQSSGVSLISHVDPGDGFNGDVVAHRGFAYLGSWGTRARDGLCSSLGVRVYDLTNATEPAHVSTFADSASEPELSGTWTEKVIVRDVRTTWFQGALAAVSVQTCLESPETFRGFALYDVSDPAQPRRLGLYRSEPETTGSHEIWLAASGDHAYVYTAISHSELQTSPDGRTPGHADFRIVDVSDPANSMEVGAWGAWKALGIRHITTDDHGVQREHYVHSVITDGDRAYLSYWDLGTVILDISDPANPTFIGRTTFGANEEGNAHSASLAHSGDLLIQTDEDFNPTPHDVLETAWGYPRFFDISDPSNPVQIGTLTLPTTPQFPAPIGFFSVHDPKVHGDLAYFSWYSEGVVVVDISDPAHPKTVAQFVPEPAPDPRGFFAPPGAEFPFVRGVFVHRGLVLASDINSGLWIFRLTNTCGSGA